MLGLKLAQIYKKNFATNENRFIRFFDYGLCLGIKMEFSTQSIRMLFTR